MRNSCAEAVYHRTYFYFSLICHFCENGYRLSAQRFVGRLFVCLFFGGVGGGGGGGGAMDD